MNARATFTRMVRAVTGNWPLKLTSLALAVLLWLVASGEESVSTVMAVQMEVRPPAGHMVMSGPARLQAVVVGPRRELLKLSTMSMLASVAVPETLVGEEVELSVGPSDLHLPPGIVAQVQELRPRRISVELDSIARRSVPVRAVVQAIPDSGSHLASDITVSPPFVQLSGPLQRVRRIDSVLTLPLELRTLDRPVERQTRLDTTGLGSVRISPMSVTVSVAIEPVAERTLSGMPVHLPAAVARAFRLDLDTVSIVLWGPRLRLAELPAESVHVMVESLGREPGRVPLRVLLPEGVRGQAQPDSATLLRRTRRG